MAQFARLFWRFHKVTWRNRSCEWSARDYAINSSCFLSLFLPLGLSNTYYINGHTLGRALRRSTQPCNCLRSAGVQLFDLLLFLWYILPFKGSRAPPHAHTQRGKWESRCHCATFSSSSTLCKWLSRFKMVLCFHHIKWVNAIPNAATICLNIFGHGDLRQQYVTRWGRFLP